MEIPVLPLSLRSIVPTNNGAAIFLTAANQKTFAIHTSTDSAKILGMTLEEKSTPRPHTHELLRRIFTGFDITVDHILITKVEDGVFHSQINLVMKNELGTKIVTIDARPSDALILAAQTRRPLFATKSVLDNADDMSEALREITKMAKTQPPKP